MSSKKPKVRKRRRIALNESSEISNPSDISSIADNNSISKTIQNMKSLDEIASLIQNANTTLQNTIANNHIALTEKIETLSTAVNTRIDAIVKICKDNVARINTIEDKLQQQVKLSELRVNGIPWRSNENLDDIFLKIATVLDYDASNRNMLPIAFRLTQRYGIQNTKNGTILLQFLAPHIKQMFYSFFIDYSSSAEAAPRIIITENLTKKNKSLFDDA